MPKVQVQLSDTPARYEVSVACGSGSTLIGYLPALPANVGDVVPRSEMTQASHCSANVRVIDLRSGSRFILGCGGLQPEAVRPVRSDDD